MIYIALPILLAWAFFCLVNSYFIGFGRIWQGSYDWLHFVAASLGNAMPAAIIATMIAGVAKAFRRNIHFMSTWRTSYIVFTVIFGFFYFYGKSAQVGMI